MDCKDWKNQHFVNDANQDGWMSSVDAYMNQYYDGASYGDDGYY